MKFKEGLDRLQIKGDENLEGNEKIDILFFIGGAPLGKITELLKIDKFKLMSEKNPDLLKLQKTFKLDIDF